MYPPKRLKLKPCLVGFNFPLLIAQSQNQWPDRPPGTLAMLYDINLIGLGTPLYDIGEMASFF